MLSGKEHVVNNGLKMSSHYELEISLVGSHPVRVPHGVRPGEQPDHDEGKNHHARPLAEGATDDVAQSPGERPRADRRHQRPEPIPGPSREANNINAINHTRRARP